MSTLELKSAISHYLDWAPFSLTIRESCRLKAMDDVLKENARPGLKVLDVGCGDGHWWKILDEKKSLKVIGIDISADEIAKAKDHIEAHHLDITSVSSLGALPADFDMVIGNCSLEHIPDINSALRNIFSRMKAGSTFVLFVPSPNWALKGHSIEWLGKISPRLSMAFSGLLNGFFQHWHLYHYNIWTHLLTSNGFSDVSVKGIGTAPLEFLFRLYLPGSFISFLVKSITGKYLNFFASKILPRSFYESQANRLVPLVEKAIVSKDDENIFEYMIVARKKTHE